MDKEKIKVMTLEKTISDMETNGVYFVEPPNPLEKEEEGTICHYSGLPSVESYMADQEESSRYLQVQILS